MLQLAKTLMYASILSGVVPLVLMLIYKKRIKQRYFIWLGLLILSSFLTDVTSLIGIKFHLFQSNTYLINFHDIIQFILLLLIYYEFYLKKRIGILIVLIYSAFEIINSLFFQWPGDQQTWSWTLSAVIFFGLAIGYVEHLLKRDPLINLFRFAPGWINIAVFFYFGLNLYLFIMANYVLTGYAADTAFIFWGFHNLNNIVKNCLFAVGIYFSNE